LRNAEPIAAAAAGHHLAGTVVCHAGAIIPRAAMPDMAAFANREKPRYEQAP
jgi:2-dehydro-3-deoxygluconokinase